MILDFSSFLNYHDYMEDKMKTDHIVSLISNARFKAVKYIQDELKQREDGESSASIRDRVIAARKIQNNRYADISGIFCNAQLEPKQMKQWCIIDAGGEQLLKNAVERLGFSARSYNRILKVARTIADLEASTQIQANHIAEAIQYRALDRDGWLG